MGGMALVLMLIRVISLVAPELNADWSVERQIAMRVHKWSESSSRYVRKLGQAAESWALLSLAGSPLGRGWPRGV